MEPSTRDQPARPRRLHTHLESAGLRLTLEYRRFDPTGCFLFLWLIGWTVGCVVLLGRVIAEPTILHLSFAIPFWAAWLLVSCLVLNSFFRRERLELGPEGIQFDCRVIIPIRQRAIPLGEIQGFGSYSTVVDSESGTREWGLEVLTHGQGLRFGKGLSDDERAWLIDQLETQLSRLMPGREPPRPELQGQDSSESFAAQPRATQTDVAGSGERLTLAAAPLAPPSDSRWVRRDDFHQLTFVTRGRCGCGALGMLLFITVFWNGIVSVFLTQLFGGEGGLQGAAWWALFVFLIPFEVIGLIMFGALVVALVEPLRRTRWSFTYGGAESQTTWLGIGPFRSYPVDRLDRIELRAASQGALAFRIADENSSPVTPNCCLVFIDCENRQQFTVDGLSQGEARWMADTVLRECQRWFR
jgi:hypothetical protein